MKKNKKNNNILVQGEVFYRTETCKAKRVTKPNFDMTQVQPKNINRGVVLRAQKVKDVSRLLSKHFGERWRENEELQFYYNLESRDEQEGDQSLNDEDCETIIEEEVDTDIV